MAHDRWQRDKTGFTYLDGRGKRGHVGFGFRTKKSRPQVEVASAAEMRRLFVLKGAEATRIMDEILGEAPEPTSEAVAAVRRGLGEDEVEMRCSDCCTAWSQDEYDARDGICCCGGEIKRRR